MADDEARARVEAERQKVRDAEAEKAYDKTAHEVADLAVGSTDPPPRPPSELTTAEQEDATLDRQINYQMEGGLRYGERADIARAGCTSKYLILFFLVLGAGAVAAILLLVGGGDSKKESNVASNPTAGGGELASFAGHYVLVEGLDDPTGLDAAGQGGLPSGSTGAGSATIDIADSGAITGGSYHASYDGGDCHRTGDGEGATGSVTSGGTGSVTFTVSHTNDGRACRSETFGFNMVYQFGIVGDDLYMCRSNMATLTTCEAAYPRLVARLHRG
ncbi:MAG: hypothetical protein QOD92_3944 [Acidimicrobiaceae bacterium]|jgi:hypothetical protein